jgi:hypothetical protein
MNGFIPEEAGQVNQSIDMVKVIVRQDNGYFRVFFYHCFAFRFCKPGQAGTGIEND